MKLFGEHTFDAFGSNRDSLCGALDSKQQLYCPCSCTKVTNPSYLPLLLPPPQAELFARIDAVNADTIKAVADRFIYDQVSRPAVKSPGGRGECNRQRQHGSIRCSLSLCLRTGELCSSRKVSCCSSTRVCHGAIRCGTGTCKQSDAWVCMPCVFPPYRRTWPLLPLVTRRICLTTTGSASGGYRGKEGPGARGSRQASTCGIYVTVAGEG